jgi:hypothetical protein
MRGLDVVRILLFFSFTSDGEMFPCALVRWFSLLDEEHDEDTGMWTVQPEVNPDGTPAILVIHLDCILRAAHLLPIYGNAPVPMAMSFHHSLDAFSAFYVNKYADHHAFEIASWNSFPLGDIVLCITSKPLPLGDSFFPAVPQPIVILASSSLTGEQKFNFQGTPLRAKTPPSPLSPVQPR